jgi:hypothetical protein
MGYKSDVKASTRTTDGRFGLAVNATGDYLGRVRVKSIQAAGVASSTVILYDGSDATGTLKLQVGFGTDGLSMILPEDGIVFENGVYLDLTATTSVTITYC